MTKQKPPSLIWGVVVWCLSYYLYDKLSDFLVFFVSGISWAGLISSDLRTEFYVRYPVGLVPQKIPLMDERDRRVRARGTWHRVHIRNIWTLLSRVNPHPKEELMINLKIAALQHTQKNMYPSSQNSFNSIIIYQYPRARKWLYYLVWQGTIVSCYVSHYHDIWWYEASF